jgi:FMN phosphatase YigB (HAD superfamily)
MKTILVDAVFTFVSEEGTINQPLYNLLEQYKNKKLIVTNANDEQFKNSKLDQVPYEVFTLKHNPKKTNPEYFRILFKHYGLFANEVIYFEHDIGVVNSAKSVGITTYFYDHTKQDLKALKHFLDENL